MTKREEAIEEARIKAQHGGGEWQDYINKKYLNGKTRSPKWGKGKKKGNGTYQSGEADWGDVIAEYVYNDENNDPYLKVERREGKQFPQYRWEGGKWVPGPPHPKIPYWLPFIIKAAPEEPIIIVEGEKDAESICDLDKGIGKLEKKFVITTNSGGARKWTTDLNKWFTGKKLVYVVPDTDEAGQGHARQVVMNLYDIVEEIRIVSIPPKYKDVSEWIAAGGTREQFLELCAAAPLAMPIIQVVGGNLSEIATRGEEVLIEAGVKIYQRGGTLVRPIIETVDASHGRLTKVARLKALDQVHLRDLLCSYAVWEKYNSREKQWVKINSPPEVATTILGREGKWTFQTIVGVITTPTMRPDGSLLMEPGYDKSTRLLLVEPPPMPKMPEKPTRKDALKALKLLEDLLKEFPFSNDGDNEDGKDKGRVAMSVAMSALISAVVRGAFPVVPMHVTRAPVASSGKSYLNDIVAAIAIGQLMPVMAAGADEEELEKRLGATLMTGQPLISIDNISGELSGDALCQIIERPIVEIRVLGKSEKVRIEARGVSIFGTGNNITIVGDLCRRVVTSTLDPKMERPELKEFKGDPVATVLANRGKYIAACLTICRAYYLARHDEDEDKRPKPEKRLASFEGWSDVVRSALTWLGMADPVKSIDSARRDDPELSKLRNLLTSWAEEIGAGETYCKTLAELIDWSNKTNHNKASNNEGGHIYPEVYGAVQAIAGKLNGPLDINGLGQWAKKNKGRIVDKLCLAHKSNSKGSWWWVDRI